MAHTEARSLAKLAGAAQRAYPAVADLYRMHTDDALPIEIRRGIVAVIEALDLLRFHIREATLGNIVTKRDNVLHVRPAPKKRKAKR
jgi:hypothetical protein